MGRCGRGARREREESLGESSGRLLHFLFFFKEKCWRMSKSVRYA